MNNKNFLLGMSMILTAADVLLENNQIISGMIFNIILGIAIGLGILNMLLPCIKKCKKTKTGNNI